MDPSALPQLVTQALRPADEGPSLGDVLKAKRRKRQKPPQQSQPAGQPKWDPAKHPRGKAGTSSGGKFVRANDTSAAAEGARAKMRLEQLSRQAIMDFQRRHGLQVDGVIGHQTATQLLTGNGKNAAVGELTAQDKKGLESVVPGKPAPRRRKRKR